MTDAYDDWRETKLRLKAEPDSVYLMRVENSLRPAALTAWLERFAEDAVIQDDDDDRQSSIALVSAEKQGKFLAVLDELRQPTYRPDETRAAMQRQVSEALTAMRKLPWTGDHLYGDALDDASLVLRAVLAGKPTPQLERFRCPSQYRINGDQLLNPVCCTLQLPHASQHLYSDAAGNSWSWTDEQSINPPKSYDEPEDRPPVELTGEQLDDLAAEVFGDGECGAVNPNPVRHGKSICVRAKQHGGLHRDADGIRWEK